MIAPSRPVWIVSQYMLCTWYRLVAAESLSVWSFCHLQIFSNALPRLKFPSTRLRRKRFCFNSCIYFMEIRYAQKGATNYRRCSGTVWCQFLPKQQTGVSKAGWKGAGQSALGQALMWMTYDDMLCWSPSQEIQKVQVHEWIRFLFLSRSSFGRGKWVEFRKVFKQAAKNKTWIAWLHRSLVYVALS